MSRRLRFSYDVLLRFDQPVSGHAFALRCVPATFPGQDILDVTLALTPQTAYAVQRDGFGNALQVGRLEDAHEEFRYTVSGSAIVDLSRRQAEAAHPMYRYPSPFTQMSAEMAAYLEGLSLPQAHTERAWALVQAVCARMTYVPGVTGVHTTAADAFRSGQGVCQDYAHLYLALARHAGLTARYVSGLTEGSGVSHAWCEVWLDGVWTGIDPTRGQWTDERYLRINVGRDFGDCPMERGIFLGVAQQEQSISSTVVQQ